MNNLIWKILQSPLYADSDKRNVEKLLTSIVVLHSNMHSYPGTQVKEDDSKAIFNIDCVGHENFLKIFPVY